MSGLKRLAAAGAACVAFLGSIGTAHAALHARDGGMVYDDVLDLTWLADMNYAKTSGVSASGTMYWWVAEQWASDLTYGGYSDWRLPTIDPKDASCSYSFWGGNYRGGGGCQGGELSHLFVVDLGNVANQSVLNPRGDSSVQLANLALFKNVQSGLYWTGQVFDTAQTAMAWVFNAQYGSQTNQLMHFPSYAVVVRSGDVAAVPEPQSGAMLLAGVGAVMLVLRRRLR